MKGRYRTGDQALVREINLSTVLRYLHSTAPLSRSGLAGLTGLNKTTVSSLVEELLDRGLVCEVGIDNSRTGRPATLLDLNPNAGAIIGVALGVDFVAIVLTDFGGNIHWRRRQATDPAQSRETMLALTLDMAEEAVAANSDHGNLRLLGLGIATPGTVNVDEGFLIFSPNLQWHNVPYRDIFQARLPLPVMVDNDANAAALAEHMFGAARQAQTFVTVFAGVGVGGGLFLNGELYRGAGGFAGEIGHTNFTLEHYRRPCRCGQRGCWETTVAQDSVVERIRSRLVAGRQSLVSQLMAEHSSPPTLAMVIEAAHAGDAEAIEVLAETGHLLGVGVANLINIFNPEMVVLGGPLSTAAAYLLPAIQQAVEDSTLPEIRNQAEIVLSAFGADASLVGAVALVVDDILAHPSGVERLSRHPARVV
ncbi:MAG TPA: ROK family transcriptional regulator [Anaerolineae bacterium]|nr:ROK family transcriptional regulator [Anaerolineae bacterium]